MKVLIADDEPLALERLELALSCIPEANLVASAKNGRDAITLIRQMKPDIVVLDVQMPGKDGLEVAAALRPDDWFPEFVFATAFSQYAVRAFEMQAVDYLLKPISFPRFREAIRRAQARAAARAGDERFAEMQRLLEALRANQPTPLAPSDIWVQTKGELTKLSASAIDRVDAEGDYVRIHTGDTSYLIKQTISAIEDKLQNSTFIRVHRSCIVNLKHIRGLRRRAPRGHILVLNNGATVAVGPSYVKELMKSMQARRWRAS